MTGAAVPARSGGPTRDGAESVAVRTGRGSLVCRTTREKANAAEEAGVGRLVAGGRVLRIRDAKGTGEFWRWRRSVSDYHSVMTAERFGGGGV